MVEMNEISILHVSLFFLCVLLLLLLFGLFQINTSSFVLNIQSHLIFQLSSSSHMPRKLIKMFMYFFQRLRTMSCTKNFLRNTYLKKICFGFACFFFLFFFQYGREASFDLFNWTFSLFVPI